MRMDGPGRRTRRECGCDGAEHGGLLNICGVKLCSAPSTLGLSERTSNRATGFCQGGKIGERAPQVGGGSSREHMRRDIARRVLLQRQKPVLDRLQQRVWA